MATQSGFLVIADIVGYTEFTLCSEIDHAEGVMKGLIGTLVESMQGPFEVAKLEDDAVFAHLPDGRGSGQDPVAALDAVYIAFRDMLFQMQRSSGCPCHACSNIGALDLKMIVHHGTYAFVTDAALSAIRTGSSRSTVPHEEALDQIGAVGGQVHDLQPVWEAHVANRFVRVEPEDAFLSVSEFIPLPPEEAWTFMHDDGNWAVWSESDETHVRRPASGHDGIGTRKHCIHGTDDIVHTIIDWRPYDYYTVDVFLNDAVRARHTAVLEPAEGGT